jgi:hypothetical protein
MEDNLAENQTHDKCKYFKTLHCPKRYKGVMKKYISGTIISPDLPRDLTQTLMLKDDVNKLCSRCETFKQK